MLKIKRVHGGEQKYFHKVIGGNFRIDALQAAVLRVKLPHLDRWSEQRRKNAELYNKLFLEAGLVDKPGKTKFDTKNKVLIPEAVYNQFSDLKNPHIFNQYIIRVEKRDELKKFLTENEIGNEIYYPVPFHQQECFSNLGYKDGDFPEAEKAASSSLALPIYQDLKEEQIKFVVEKINEILTAN